MNPTEAYLGELEASLHVRGRARRRLLAECRDHLADAADVHGPEEAVRRFGPVAGLVSSFETEVAVRRGLAATDATAVGVLAVAGSTLAMLHASASQAAAPVAWALVFFASAQTAAVCLGLSVLQRAAMRYTEPAPADVALLCRRNGLALGFALLTMLAAGGAVPGHTDAWRVLAGPAVALLAAISIGRAALPLRHLRRRRARVVRTPVADLAALAHRLLGVDAPAWATRAHALLPPVLAIATVSAFAWDHLDHGTAASSSTAAGIEAAFVLVGFVLLGPALGLRPGRSLSRR